MPIMNVLTHVFTASRALSLSLSLTLCHSLQTFGKQDPFVTLTFANKRKRTATHNNGGTKPRKYNKPQPVVTHYTLNFTLHPALCRVWWRQVCVASQVQGPTGVRVPLDQRLQ